MPSLEDDFAHWKMVMTPTVTQYVVPGSKSRVNRVLVAGGTGHNCVKIDSSVHFGNKKRILHK